MQFGGTTAFSPDKRFGAKNAAAPTECAPL